MNTQTINTLMIKNIKGIKQIKIVAGDVNEICGENGAGKSSILDSIAFAFGGKKIIDKKALRDGEKNGVIDIETNDLVISRKFTQTGTTLTVKGKNGGKYAQKDLNGIFSMISFDPLEFSRSSSEKQVEIVKNILGDEFNNKMDDIRSRYQLIYEERTDIGRQGKAIGELVLPEKVERVDVSELMKELEKIDEENSKVDQNNKKLDSLKNDLFTNENEIKILKEQMNDLRNKYKIACDRQDDIKNDLSKYKLEDRLDNSEIKEKIKNASDINNQANEYDIALAKQKEKAILRDKYDNKSKVLSELDEQKSDLIKNAKLPVPGLSLSDSGVTLNDIPIEQISSAEKLMLSTKIACSINSDLKIIMIKDGSLLDSKSFELVTEFCKANGYQLWIETVGSGVTQDKIEISEGEFKDVE